jgi:hypothetical protein
MKGRFGGLKEALKTESGPAPVKEPAALAAVRSRARDGKKAVVGYFSGELSDTLRMMSIAEKTSVQALLGEAIDLLMRAKGKHPFGER